MVVILCLFLAYSKKKCFTFAAICDGNQMDSLDGIAHT